MQSSSGAEEDEQGPESLRVWQTHMAKREGWMLQFEQDLRDQPPLLPHGESTTGVDRASPVHISMHEVDAEDVHAAMQGQQHDRSEPGRQDDTHSDGCDALTAAASGPVAAAAGTPLIVDAVHHTPSGLERQVLFEQYRQDEERRQAEKERKHEENEAQAQLLAVQEEVGVRMH